mmetsp:Transcript_8417/g.33262  ORF Transcript_8417/g.33262 Transcript_8417/m.33262 type:complete len:212 (-) Transcript_8417:929-1564(-)
MAWRPPIDTEWCSMEGCWEFRRLMPPRSSRISAASGRGEPTLDPLLGGAKDCLRPPMATAEALGAALAASASATDAARSRWVTGAPVKATGAATTEHRFVAMWRRAVVLVRRTAEVALPAAAERTISDHLDGCDCATGCDCDCVCDETTGRDGGAWPSGGAPAGWAGRSCGERSPRPRREPRRGPACGLEEVRGREDAAAPAAAKAAGLPP